MLFYEDFVRCTKCRGAFFRKNVTVSLNKAAFGTDPKNRQIKEDKTITTYNCSECGHEMASVTSENENLIRN